MICRIMKCFLALFFGWHVFTGTALAWCTLYDANGALSSTAETATGELNISTAFNLADNSTQSLQTTWSSTKKISCAGGEQVEYLTGVGEVGYIVGFADTATGNITGVKFTSSPDTTRYTLASGDTPLASLNVTYTLNATLANVTSYDQIVTGGSVDLYPVGLIPAGVIMTIGPSTGAWLRNNYSSSSYVHAYQKLTVTFEPSATTCTIADKVFYLPPITMDALRSGDTGDTKFSIPVNCSNSLAGLNSRAANMRFYSNDIVDAAHYIIRNSGSTAQGVGFQLFSDAADPLVFSHQKDSASSSLLAIQQGTTFQPSYAVDIGARYKIYDASTLKTGRVVGTVIAYMDYD